MPDPHASAALRERMPALVIVGVLAIASVLIALIGVTPARVGATEVLGDERTPGEAAFIASHRGGGATAPENTLPAIAAALAAGFDYVEVDVALTADRHPVLLHDATLDRTTDGHGRVADHTLDEVRALDAGSWFDPQYAGTRVPTLTEFLDLLTASPQRAIVEFKGEWEAAAVQAAIAEVSARDLDRRVAIASFDTRTLALVEAASEVVPRLLILKHLPDDVVAAAAEAGVRGVLADRKAVARLPEVVDELHAAGVRVIVYTLNKDAQWDEMTALGVDGIVTDDPGTLSQWQQIVADAE
ncbi:glycerophosphodiester phosphodiesterase family protein [Microbacterium aoyamense]|uniref:Glycerophosphodiester phosphodiesterase family protein n=1 Tax=Microbacterium aoyamense TaxID=344166 RepID=A0ABP5B716_9MICO|nr:glycerophosphodiester phosphodiesterase family protein [Microbacterium aoyamense]